MSVKLDEDINQNAALGGKEFKKTSLKWIVGSIITIVILVMVWDVIYGDFTIKEAVVWGVIYLWMMWMIWRRDKEKTKGERNGKLGVD